MATVAYTPNACPALLLGQREVMKNNTPTDLISAVGITQALLDPTNIPTREFSDLGTGNGGKRFVRLAYKQPVTDAEITDAYSCDAGTTQPYQEELVALNLHAHYSGRLNESDLRALCDGYAELVKIPVNQRNGQKAQDLFRTFREIYEGVVMPAYDAMRRNINTKLNTAYATKIGEFLDGATSKSYTVRTAELGGKMGAPVLDGFAKMKQDIRKTTFGGMPITFGAGIWELATDALGYGCCNDGGTDFGQMARNAGFKYYRDDTTGTALANANAIGAFMPGTAHFLHVNTNVGPFASPIGNMARGTVADPALPGVEYDIEIQPNECGKYYDIRLDLDFGLWAAPTNIFKAADYRFGVNGLFKIIASEYTPA